MRRNPYYHGSKTPLEIGTIIRPKKDGYAQRQFEDGSEDNWVERAMEAGRPPNKLSRLESVFLLKLDGDQTGDDGFLFEHAGGYGDYVYEVEPLGRVEGSDLRWYTAAAYPRTELGRKRAISAYWRGKPAGYQMEYRTPAARVIRLAGGSTKGNMLHGEERMKNPSTVESLRQSISDYGPKFAAKFEDFYPASASGELRPHSTEKLYRGKKVHWIGTPGHMVRVTPDYVTNLEGNIFDHEKLAAVSWFIRRSDRPVVMRPGYGQVVATTSIDDIAESLQYAKDAEIFGEDRTLSTDDEELDAYLKDPQTYLSDNIRWYDGPGSESEDEDVAKAGLRAQMEEKKAEAVREGWGDLGARRFKILDGNHRSFGALLAGEPFIWIRLLENDYQDFMRGGRPDLKGVLENPAETHFDDFLRELPFFLESDEALAAISGLNTHGNNPWLGGGCFVLTEALLELLGLGASALDIVSDGLDLHSVVEAGGVWIDGGGSFAPAQANRLFPGMTGTEPHERMADKRMVKRLVSALRARFGTVLL